MSEPSLLTLPVPAQTDPQPDHRQEEDDQGHVHAVDEADGVGAPVGGVSAAGHGGLVEEAVGGADVGGVAAGVVAVLEGGAAVALLAGLEDVVAAERGHGLVGGIVGGVLVALAVGWKKDIRFFSFERVGRENVSRKGYIKASDAQNLE